MVFTNNDSMDITKNNSLKKICLWALPDFWNVKKQNKLNIHKTKWTIAFVRWSLMMNFRWSHGQWAVGLVTIVAIDQVNNDTDH